MANTKIKTWIHSKQNIHQAGSQFSFAVKPFQINYKGENKTISGNIRQIKFIDNNDNFQAYYDLGPGITENDSRYSHGRIEIDLEGKGIKTEDNGQTLVIKGSVPAKSWDWSSDFRFTLTSWKDWDQVGERKLILNIQEQTVDPSSFSPLIKKIIVHFKDWDEKKRNKYKRNLVQGQEYSLNLATSKASNAEMITENRLDLQNPDWSIPTLNKVGATTNSSTNNQTTSQVIDQESEEVKKVNEAYQKAKTAYENRKNNLEEAISALKALLALGKNGTTAQQKRFQEVTTQHELDSMESELVFNSYQQTRSEIPNFNNSGENSAKNNSSTSTDKNNSNKRKSDDDASDGSNKKPRTDEGKASVEVIRKDLKSKNETKTQTITDTLANLIEQAKTKNDYAGLLEVIQKIDAFKGEKAYLDKETEIMEQKKRLVKLDVQKYKDNVAFQIKDKLEKNGIATSDLDADTQNLIKRVGGSERVSENDIIEIEKKTDEAIGIKNALNKLEKLILELEMARKSKDKQKGDSKLQELVTFIESTVSYQQKAYQQKRNKVDSLLKSETNSGSPNKNKDNNFPWTPILLVGGVITLGIIGLLAVRNWRDRRREEREI